MTGSWLRCGKREADWERVPGVGWREAGEYVLGGRYVVEFFCTIKLPELTSSGAILLLVGGFELLLIDQGFLGGSGGCC